MVLLIAIAGAIAWCMPGALFSPCFALDQYSVPGANDVYTEGDNAFAAAMRIYSIDVGHGDGALVIFPDGTTMLIDCGSGSDVINVLKRLGVGKLNYMVVTHDHSDHTSGFSNVVGAGYTDSNTKAYAWANVYLEGVHWQGVNAGDVIYSAGNLTVTCVTSNGNIIGGAYVPPKSENDTSVGLLISYRGFDYLSCGDIEYRSPYKNVEEPLGEALKARGAQVDVYKVDHHGSAYGSSSNFLNNIKPEYAIVSVGAGTGFPYQDAVSRMNAAGVRILFETEPGSDATASPMSIVPANGNILTTTNGATYSFTTDDASTPFSYGPFQVDQYVTPEAPHLIVTEAAIGSSYYAPENYRWIELHLPPGGEAMNLSNLYWVSKGQRGRLAKSGPLTMAAGDVTIVHNTEATASAYIDESDATGKGGNGWWDVYTHLDGKYWVTNDDCFMISRENAMLPKPLNIIDALIWSNHNNDTPANAITPGNYLISGLHWGNPVAGGGLFTATDDSSGIGDINSGYAQRKTTEDTDSVQDWVMSAVNSEGTPPPTPGNPPEPIATPTPRPIVVVLNRTSVEAGETLTVDVVAQPLTGRPFDAYAAIMDSRGGILFWIRAGNSLSSGQTPFPIVTKVGSLPNGYSGRLLSVTVPPGSGGDYRIGAGLVDSGKSVKKTINPFIYDIADLSVR
ncbi:MAG: MBL fold metallo-hydrolase [Candidatus Aureabacteria bacterium]|nr:MBL fold metallo-hydrolase [Candidatus Auribacterota bacterium]